MKADIKGNPFAKTRQTKIRAIEEENVQQLDRSQRGSSLCYSLLNKEVAWLPVYSKTTKKGRGVGGRGVG